MNKKIAWIASLLILTVSLSGCWSYVGLNNITIVAGMAIDKDEENNLLKITFEVIDLTVGSKEGVKAKIIESEGKTIFDALRNGRKKVSGKLYVGNMQIVVINEKIAYDENVSGYIDFLIRDIESRETSNLIIYKGKSAKEIFDAKLFEREVISFEIKKLLDKDPKIVASTKANQLYQIYNILNSKGYSLVLPAVKIVQNDKKPVFEIDGVAVYQNEKMVGYLSAEESKYFLFADDQLKGGIFTFGTTKTGETETALELVGNKTKTEFTYEGESIKVKIKTNSKAFLGEMRSNADFMEENVMENLEKKAEEILEQRILAVIKKTQLEYKADILGLGNKIYQSNPRLWKKLESNWENIYPALEVSVESDLVILDSSTLSKS